MIMTSTAKTVREIALEQPHSIRVFERLGIDYCCGGRRPLAEACNERNIPVDVVLAALDAAAGANEVASVDWSKGPMGQLITHIVATHHAFVKRELPRLATLAEKVVSRHGDTQAHLPALQRALAQLDKELTQHLAKEENILFPFIAGLEAAQTSGSTQPSSCFGTVANPIAMMTREHDAAGGLLAEMDRLSEHFTTPAGACPTYHAFYDGLKEFEQDLHQHIHLENNILFPRAIEMEASAVSAVA
jgi:regulator of cell morphogenesis and NO signaling